MGDSVARIKAMKKNVTLFAHLDFAQLSKQHLLKLSDYAQHILVAMLILMMLAWGLSSAQRPINAQQQQHLHALMVQGLYPDSKETALYLREQARSTQSAVNQFQYFKLLRIHHKEQKRIHFQQAVEAEQMHN